MNRIAVDENLHMLFYRDIVKAALDADPSSTAEAIAAEVVGFDMPGIGIEGFTHKALQISQVGIYDLRIHCDQVVWPLLRHWDFFGVEGLSGSAERARENLAAHLARIDRLATRFEVKRSRIRTARPSEG